MGIFTKTAKLSDPFVLQFSKKDNQALQQPDDLAPVLSNVVADRQAKQDVLKRLPLMTLGVACPFFKALRALAVDQGTSYEFETIDVLILTGEGRHQKYKPFINVENFSVDRLYRDFTGAFITTVFTNSDIAEVDYKQKQTWATMFIDAYQNANPRQKVVAMVPSEAASEQAPFKVQYVGLDVVDKPAKKQSENKGEQPAKKPESSEKQDKSTTGKSSELELSNPKKQVSNKEKGGQNQQSAGLEKTSKGYRSKFEEDQRSKKQTEKRQRVVQTKSNRLEDGQIKAPQFEVNQIKSVTEDDDKYVAYQCDQKKQHSNGFLLSLEKRVNAAAVQSLTQLREKQRQEIQSALVSFKKNNDPTKQLRNEVKQLISKEKQAEQKKMLSELTTSRDSDITQIKADADRAVKQREQEYKHQIKEQQAALDQTFIKKANELSATRLADRQAALKKQSQALQKDLEQQARAAYNEMVGSLVADHQNVVGSAYQKLAKSIDDYALEVTKVHLNAVEVQASADRAKFNLTDLERLEAQTEQLKQAKQQLAQEKSKLQQLIDRQSQELAQVKGSAPAETSREQASKLDQLIALQLANTRPQAAPATTNETGNNNNTKRRPASTWIATGLGSLLVMMTLGGGGLWAYQNNQQVKSALSATQSQLSQTQQAASSMDKRYSELGATNQDLKAKVGEQQSQLSKTKADSSSAAKQAQADKEAVATRTSSANKTTEKGK
ncbi:hypothetical protein [Lactiplantibacillus plantarum]|uniref:hypothetical protein n=1 Tax=Lactiplantibacillus plantarum TaxID=1590 RepID=UPI001BA67A7B|nr:hypothetical protein [Lactiplantibacillus plantarum]MBS0935720.1 hypothetical protein [Lactiplantibacillus plantarum]MBS0943923.1 hypothetical protein [Lactiplantibacillus plantarum]